MGNRVKGRPKKSSIKAASHSKMGSKRKLSRMGKKQKKNNAGLEATFIGRSKCLKMLQVTIKDFRRLCILKGIYPREPRGRFPGQKKGQTFYHIKDIRAIAHEPVLEKFREFRTFTKKVRIILICSCREQFRVLILTLCLFAIIFRCVVLLAEMSKMRHSERMPCAQPTLCTTWSVKDTPDSTMRCRILMMP